MRILGIDIGSSSIKALEMESAFGRFDIHDYHEFPFNEREGEEKVLARLIGSLAKAPDRVVVAMPPDKVTLRNLQLPTRDKKAILAGVGFELEDELPFALEDAVYDYTILHQAKQGSTIHVASTLKTHLGALLFKLDSGKISPDLVTTEPWAYRMLLNKIFVNNSPATPVLLMNIGRDKTVFYVQNKDIPVFVREIAWGGGDLTQAIMNKFGLSKEQAEAAKLDRGVILSSTDHQEVTPEHLEMSECLREALSQSLGNELRQVALMTNNLAGQGPGQIYLAGSTALLSGLTHWMQEQLQVPAQILPSLSSITSSGVTYSDQSNATFPLAAALALCMVSTNRNNSINFRKGEFSKSGKNRELNLKILRKPLIATAIVVTTLLLSLTIQSAVYRSKMETTQAALEKNVRTFFGAPSANTVRTYMINTNNLRKAINKELDKQRELARLFGPNPRSPTDYLHLLSKTIPKDLVVDMTYFQSGTPTSDSYVSGTGPAATQMTFLVSNPQNLERLNSLLGDKVAGLQRGKTEETVLEGEAQKKWKVTFSGKPVEESYGK
ncbi:MAG: pilus assembly protein PilM [Bdellovibrio sp.]|nr:pilus assembly protein PilM [Bdellovibrio sp.]